MGNSASIASIVNSEQYREIVSKYNPEEKAEIAKLYKEKFDLVKATEAGKTMTDIDVLKHIQEEYDQSKGNKKKKSVGIIRLQNTNTAASSSTNRIVVTQPHTEFGAASVSAKLRSNIASAKTNEELLRNTTDEEHTTGLNNFLSRLQIQSNQPAEDLSASSEFRQRRLSTAQRITHQEHEVDAPVAEPVKRRVSVAGEIGDNDTGPFDPACVGKFSCHGIEPANNPSGVHDKINQDRGCYVYPYNNSYEEILFMALDGHGQEGDKVSEFAMQQIVATLENHPQLNTDPAAALIDTFVTTNRALASTKIQYYSSGSTCVTVLMRGAKLYIASVGDSRAVIGHLGSDGAIKATDLTHDHKPNDPVEKARILASGGFVSDPPKSDPTLSSRVWLDKDFRMIGLAMSRSIGDYAVKAVGVTATPEVTTHDLLESDKFLILASDGVWEFITNQMAVEIVNSRIHLGANIACEELITEAARRWQREEGDYRDDITALVVKLPLEVK